MSPSAPDLVALVDDTMRGVFAQLDSWRTSIETVLATEPRAAELDDAVASLVLPVLADEDSLLVGAGFIADADAVGTRGVHFAWWLGPLEDNPVLGATTVPTRLDLSTRGYTEYLRDFRSLEWFRVPTTTFQAHVTGPYVDHLCTCDYILTFTSPVRVPGDGVAGVVGADVAVRRLEREVLPALLRVEQPMAIIGEYGRVIVSTAPGMPVASIVPEDAVRFECATAPFAIVPSP
ncbi:MAG TPA: hypothetical protein VJR25_06375 [Microbacterium sp.]|uniref:hypothetical protein n=1 Tax=Microbacterium sp. TaxID=51671 RepID=UPI002B4743FC|nr:hypothetical protein [Microbacterium sp.]HKT56378.1 hypothetical protein [Microbacterium sp.]